jgi:hypothetical protein
MTQSTEPHDPYEMAALKKQRAKVIDPMAVGPGTPWEDRGNLGVVVAFFKTCLASMFKPGELADQIRRPDAAGDTGVFTIACGVMWGLSVFVHSLLTYLRVEKDPKLAVDAHQFWITTSVQIIAAIAVTWVALRIAANLYGRIIEFDMKQKPPGVLVINLLAYGLGPSLLAPIPYAGPLVAWLWILIAWAAIGKRRLGVKTSAAVITPLLTMAAVLLTMWGIYFGLYELCTNLWDMGSVQPLPGTVVTH